MANEKLTNHWNNVHKEKARLVFLFLSRMDLSNISRKEIKKSEC